MTTDLVPVPAAGSLGEMSLANAPDLLTAIAAGEAHGLAPSEALKSAFGKWMSEHADAVQRYGLANFYDGKDANRAFVNETRLLQFAVIMLDQQAREIRELRASIEHIPSLTP